MNLESKRLDMELARVIAARKELEFKVLEREEDIRRLKEHITIQLNKEKELSDKLKGINNG